MEKIKITNRYKDVFTLTVDEEGNILWEGDFQWCRYGWPNNYSKAYEAYLDDGGNMLIEDFKVAVHEYNEDYTQKEITRKYGPLVKSDTSKIDMVDPSGGPYIGSNYNMGVFDESLRGMIVENFIPIETGYKIIIKK